jgi:hypothetical protein
MAKEKLMEKIEDVREELISESTLGPEDRDIIGSLLTDIIAHLTEHEQDKATHEDLKGRVEQAINNLEMKHPRLATMLGRMANLLSSLGI